MSTLVFMKKQEYINKIIILNRLYCILMFRLVDHSKAESWQNSANTFSCNLHLKATTGALVDDNIMVVGRKTGVKSFLTFNPQTNKQSRYIYRQENNPNTQKSRFN